MWNPPQVEPLKHIASLRVSIISQSQPRKEYPWGKELTLCAITNMWGEVIIATWVVTCVTRKWSHRTHVNVETEGHVSSAMSASILPRFLHTTTSFMMWAALSALRTNHMPPHGPCRREKKTCPTLFPQASPLLMNFGLPQRFFTKSQYRNPTRFLGR